jgi:transposase
MSPQRRHELTDAQWERLAALLPSQRPRTGRPAKDHRSVLNGILWVLRTGAPWRDLPQRYGSWQMVYRRFRRWRDAGVGEHVLTTLPVEAAHDGTLDDTLAMIDGTSIRAQHQAAGAPKGRPTPPSGGAEVAGAASCTW